MSGLLSQSKRGVTAFSGFMLSARRRHFLHAFSSMWALPIAEEYHWQSSIALQACTAPLWNSGHCTTWCEGSMEVFQWRANLPVRRYRRPPPGGYLVQWPPRHSCSQRSDDADPVYWGLLYKLIWEDAERGKCVGPCSCTASVHSCQWRQAEWLDLHVSWMSWFLIHCMHVFECDAVVRPLCPMANLFVGVFVWALAPFCVSALLFPLTKRKSGWGICGSSGWSVWWLVCCDLPAFPGLFGPCTNGVFTAYAHVRTEPQCDIGHTRGKKNAI